MHDQGYNERLFERSPLRRYYHTARYRWVERELRKRPVEHLRVFELGSFDGKLLDFLPQRFDCYVGVDANWEGGVDLARTRFHDRADVEFVEAASPEALERFSDGEFNLAVALETLEHIQPAILRDYLRGLARITKGPLLVSVPNEMGPVFVAKYLAKKLKFGACDKYVLKEFIAAATWRPEHVQRDEHKGFDYRKLVEEISEFFDIHSVEGVPPMGLPPSLSLTVGIVAHSR